MNTSPKPLLIIQYVDSSTACDSSNKSRKFSQAIDSSPYDIS